VLNQESSRLPDKYRACYDSLRLEWRAGFVDIFHNQGRKWFAAGQAAAKGAISIKIAALTEGALKPMLRTKLMNVGALLVVLVMITGAGAVIPRTVAARPAEAADAKYFKLVHADTGKVLSVADNSDEAGAKAVLAKDEGSKGQQWKLEKDGDHYKIVNRNSGKVLDVESD
jgi:hypothetical protein